LMRILNKPAPQTPAHPFRNDSLCQARRNSQTYSWKWRNYMTDPALLLLLVTHLFQSSAGDYRIDELRDENATTLPPFSISRVVPFDGGLRLFLSTHRPDAVASLLTAGTLEAQLSDHKSETAKPVSLSLGKAVWCSNDGNPVFVAYRAVTPLCGGRTPARIETSSKWQSGSARVAISLSPRTRTSCGLSRSDRDADITAPLTKWAICDTRVISRKCHGDSRRREPLDCL
jgi:hypothetical protein